MISKITFSGLDNFGLGRLINETDDRVIDYQPFEVSKSRLGIIAPKGLEIGAKLVLATVNNRKVKLIVESYQQNAVVSNYIRYKLTNREPETNLEEVFSKAGCDKYLETISAENPIQNPRFELEPSIRVAAQTFGCKESHIFHTVNVSKSGMLLNSNYGDKVPFIKNTLLELHLDSKNNQWLKGTIQCLGKVVRISTVKNANNQMIKQVGIRFVELSHEATGIWNKTLQAIEDSYHSNEVIQNKESSSRNNAA